MIMKEWIFPILLTVMIFMVGEMIKITKEHNNYTSVRR